MRSATPSHRRVNLTQAEDRPKSCEIVRMDPKVYVYTPRGDIRAKQAENPLSSMLKGF